MIRRGDMMRILANVAALGPEGGHIERLWIHSLVEQCGFIELWNGYARVTGEGLDELSKERLLTTADCT